MQPLRLSPPTRRRGRPRYRFSVGGGRQRKLTSWPSLTSVFLSAALLTSNGEKLESEDENDDDWGGTNPLPARCAPAHSC